MKIFIAQIMVLITAFVCSLPGSLCQAQQDPTSMIMSCTPVNMGDPLEEKLEFWLEDDANPSIEVTGGMIDASFILSGISYDACTADVGLGLITCTFRASEGPGDYEFSATYSGTSQFAPSELHDYQCVVNY